MKISFIIFFIFILGLFQNLYSKEPILLKNYPLVVDSNFYPTLGGASSIAADINNDGNNELIFISRSGHSGTKVFVLNADGSFFPNWPKILYTNSFSTFAVGDINNDNQLDICVRTSDSLFVFNHLSLPLSGFPIFIPAVSGIRNISIYDLDNDYNLEIITNNNNYVYVINSNGMIRQGWPVRLPGIPGKVFIAPPSVGDLNNDNIPEIIFGSSYCEPGQYCDSNYISIFQPNGSHFEGWPIKLDSNYNFYSNPATIFFDKKNLEKVIMINSSKYNPISFDSTINRTSRYNSKSELLSRINTWSYYESSSIAVAEFNTLNNIDYCFGSEPNPVYLFSSKNILFNGWPIDIKGYYYNTPAIAKLSNENNIIGYGFSATSDKYIYGFNSDGSELDWSPLEPDSYIRATPTLCDLNKDGQLDMIAVTEIIFSPTKSGTKIFVWTFPGINYNIKNLPWPMYAHDRYRTNQYGFIPPDEPVSIQPINASIPESFRLYQNFPNPFNPSTRIKFDVNKREFINLTIFDILGRKIETLVNEELIPGSYSMKFENETLTSGIYFYTLIVGGDKYKETKKMILIR